MGPARACLDDIVEPLRDEIEPRRVDAARRERQPEVDRPDAAAQERPVLVPVTAVGHRDASQRALVRGEDRSAAEVVGDEGAQPELGVEVEHLDHQPR